MPNNYTNVFGGTTIYPSDVSYLALALSANTTLEWPLESAPGNNLAARILDVTPSADGYSITMPDATKTGSGQTTLFNNLNGGSYSFYVKDNTGSTIATVAPGEQWQIYLAANTTAAGTWRVFRYGASTATVQPSALAGYGLTVTDSTLSAATAVSTFVSTPRAVLVTDRAKALIWTGSGTATVTLPLAADAGNNYFVSVRNEGGGNVTVDPAGSETVNGETTLTLSPGDSITLITDGISWYTLGLGQDAIFAFDYTSIDLSGESGTYTLTGSELNRIAYDFIGALAGNVEIVVPSTTQQYWVSNNTTNAYTLGLKTSSQTPAVDVSQGFASILYCDGSNVVAAAASTASLPAVVPASGGGTGQSSYTVGDLLYASAATTLSKLADVATGNALISGGVTLAPSWGKIGLSTHVSGTLPVANGGTGQTTYTDGQLLIGNSTGNTLAKATLTAGTNVSVTNGSGAITLDAFTNWLNSAGTYSSSSWARIYPATGTNVNVVISPLGTGAIQAVVADGTTTGGNNRGSRAVDFQASGQRAAANQVASGTNSVISGGYGNKSSGIYDVVSGGTSNSASGTYSVVSGGTSNSASGTYSVVSGGGANTASGLSSVVSGGSSNVGSGSYSVVSGGISNAASGDFSVVNGGNANTASGSYSVISGGYGGTTRAIVGNQVTSIYTGISFTAGSAQASKLVISATTTDASNSVLTSDAGTAGTTNQVILPNYSAYYFSGSVVAKENNVASAKAWKFEGLIRRANNAASTALVSAVTPTVVAADSGTSLLSISVTADTTNGGLKIGTNISYGYAGDVYWVGKIETTEVVE